MPKKAATKKAPRKKARAKKAKPSVELTIRDLVEQFNRDAQSLTPKQLREVMQLRKMSGQDSGTGYAAHRDNMASRARASALSVREIGAIPLPADPERRALAMADFRVFCETYFPGRFYLDWSVDHPKVIAAIGECSDTGGLYALAMPRGSGKTSLVECAALWCVFRGVRHYVAVIAATGTKATSILDSIKTELQANAILAADFPEVCYPIWQLDGVNQRSSGQLVQGRPTSMVWQAKKLVLPTVKGSAASGAIFQVAGLKSGDILGLKHTVSLDDGTTTINRPDFLMVDDPQTPESARSPAQCASREAILSGAVLGLAGPGVKIAAFALVTVIADGDLADTLLNRDKNPDWRGERYKMVYAFPTAEKLWAEYARLRGERLARGGKAPAETEFYAANRSAMDAGAVVAWPERHEPDELSGLQSAINIKLRDPIAFASEYQNTPERPEEHAGLLTPAEIAARTSGHARRAAPPQVEYVSAFIDCHDKLLYWMVCAWAADFTGWIVDYGTAPEQGGRYFTLRQATRTLARKHPRSGREGAIRAGLDDLSETLITATVKRSDGVRLPVGRCMIDAGYERDVVYEFIRTCGLANVVPSFGRPIGASRMPMAEYTKKPGDRLASHWMITSGKRGDPIRHAIVDVNYFKTFVHSRMNVAKGDPGALLLPGENPAAHRLLSEHLVAEYPIQTAGPWGRVDEWQWKANRPDNHWFDCLVGCAAGASMLGARLPGTEALVETKRKRYTRGDMRARQVATR